MAEVRNRENDLVLIPRQSALIKDLTKGYIALVVGPFKMSLSDTDQLQVRDSNTGNLRDAKDQQEAIQAYTDVPEGDYVVLTNPAVDMTKWPEPKRSNDMQELAMGRKVNLPGPLSFPLWPFQTARLIKGHQLQMNQYVLVRVINDVEALKNWNHAVIKPQSAEASTEVLVKPTQLAVGQLLVIKGTEVSFYIPPTGLEVVADENGQYVREAVTLEQLEYCVLVDQSGTKRYERGPQVVFPGPSETFITSQEEGHKAFRKFKAVELTPISGIHIKVSAPYDEDVAGTTVHHEPGEELFITGTEQPIYFPRAEHAIVKYDDRSIYYATAIPKGEGRYVMDRFTGAIRLGVGPSMLLPDPRKEVLVKRVLPERQVRLWYPNNTEALRINLDLTQQAEQTGSLAANYLATGSVGYSTPDRQALAADAFSKRSMSSSNLAGDSMGRKTVFTPPRQLTLNTKYEGAVAVDVWTGYAVMLVNRNGDRKVVQGPKTVLLEFDQSLATVRLSTGKPKTTDRLCEDVFLRVSNNPVSDIIAVETADSFQAKIKVSYRVSFTGDSDKWFNVENYIKLLCDHTRSKIRNAVKQVGLQEFNRRYISIVRDTVLGAKGEAKDGAPAPVRPGLTFAENGMTVNDVEVLELTIDNSTISNLLIQAQQKLVENTLTIARSKQDLEMAEVQETIIRNKCVLAAQTAMQKAKWDRECVEAELSVTLVRLAAQQKQFKESAQVHKLEEVINDLIAAAKLQRTKAIADQAAQEATTKQQLDVARLEAETAELCKRAEAIKPDLIQALQGFGDKATVQELVKAMAPMALLGGGSVADVVNKMFSGTGLEDVIKGVSASTLSRSKAGLSDLLAAGTAHNGNRE